MTAYDTTDDSTMEDTSVSIEDTPEENTILPAEEKTPDTPLPSEVDASLPEESTPPESPSDEPEPAAEPEPVMEAPQEPVIEENTAQPETEEVPAPQVDLTPILEVLGQLQAQVTKLGEDFNTKLRYDASKKEIIDKQFQELDAYHREAHEKLSKAIVMDIISEIDGAERSAEHYESLTPTQENFAKLKKLIVAHAEDLRDILENNDITSYRTEPGEAFNHKRHSVLKTIPTENPELSKTIQASLRWGFEKDGKVLRPEKVAVYVLTQQQ